MQVRYKNVASDCCKEVRWFIKVKYTLVQALRLCTGRTARRRSRGIALRFLDHGTRRGVRGQRHAPAALTPGKTRCPLYMRLGRPQGRSGQVRKISPLPGFVPRTVQPVANRYTDWAIPAHLKVKFTLEQATKVQRRSSGITLFFL